MGRVMNRELQISCYSPDIIRVIKSRRIRWAGPVTNMKETRNAYRVLIGNPNGGLTRV
jgi:hypothetical protein